MVVYKGFGHGITKPESMRAVMQHSLGGSIITSGVNPLPDFIAPELPKKEGTEKKADEK